MNLAIDIGNTALKWAAFEGRDKRAGGVAANAAEALTQWRSAGVDPQEARVMVAASGACPEWGFAYGRLSADMPLPVGIGYRSPATLGADRLADACGAVALHPATDTLIIDAGTCITVDFVDATGRYHGGAIMPGLDMGLRALNAHTERLPLVELGTDTHAPVLGRTTEESIVAGTLGATLLALAGFVATYRAKVPGLHVLLTGGDAPRLTAGAQPDWEHVPDLTLRGINEAIIHNANHHPHQP